MLLGTFIGFFASALGWQVNLVSIHRGLKRGKTSAFLVGAGAACGDILFMAVAFAGVDPLLDHPQLWIPLKYLATCIIFVIGLQILFHRPKGRAEPEIKNYNPTKNFFIGFFLVVTNPAVFLLWVGVISFIMTHFPEAESEVIKLKILGGFFAGALGWFLILALVLLPKIRQWGDAALHYLSRLSAVILLLAAVILIF